MNNKKIIFLIVLFLPFLYLCYYAHPYADDMFYAAYPHNVFNETNNVFLTLKAVIEQCKDIYYSWQGTFGSVILFGLNPIIFSYKLYFINLVLLFLFYIFAIYKFINSVINKVSLKQQSYILTSLAIAFLILNTFKSIYEYFYCYNSAVYYNFFNSLFLVAFSSIINNLYNQSKIKNIIIAIMFFIIGSGNFLNSLLSLFLLIIILLYFVRKKNIVWRKLLLYFTCVLFSFIISVVSPGNHERYITISEHMGAVESIFMSLKESVFLYAKIMDYKLIFMLIIIYFLPRINDKYLKVNPIVVAIFMIIIGGVEYTPTYYAQGNSGPFRVYDMIYQNSCILLFLFIYYTYSYILKYKAKLKNVFSLFIVFIFLINLSLLKQENNLYYVIEEIVSHRIYDFYDERMERNDILNKSTNPNMEVKAYEVHSNIFGVLDLESEPTSWINKAYARYYNIDSIKTNK